MRPVQRGRQLPAPFWVAVAAIAITTAALLMTAPWPKHRRFVSSPLPDGTRYTYPSYLYRIRDARSPAPGVEIGQLPVWEAVLDRWPLWTWRPGGAIKVYVTAMTNRRSPSSRTHSREPHRTGGITRLVVADAGSGKKFHLFCTLSGTTAEAFAAAGRAIGHSFRVLPPGAAPPSR